MNLMQKARSQMCVRHVFWGTLMMTTPLVEDRTCKTAWTDMVRIGYNPDFIEGLNSSDLVQFVLAHELAHQFGRHGLRRGPREHRLWNRACDYVVNLMLRDSDFRVWDQALIDERFRGMSPEAVYALLDAERQGSPQAGGGAQPDDEPGDGSDPSHGPGQPQDDGLPKDGCGDDLRDAPGALDPAVQAKIDGDIRGKVARAAAMARMAGKLPAGIARLVDEALNPPQPWQTVFADFMTRVVYDNETWSRRNRRFQDIYLPARHELRMGEVVIVGDTSGSMGNAVFGQIGVEINAMVEFCKPERVRVIWADDTDCALEEIFEPGEEVVLHPKGGGGTDMRKPLRFVERYDPAVVVLVTDGETPWPDSPPPYPLIVCCTTGRAVPVGDVIRV